MKFNTEYTDIIEARTLVYREEECSFDMTPWSNLLDFELSINKITITVKDEKLIQLSGFCGYNEWIKSNFSTPRSKKGVVKVIDKLAEGFSYRIRNKDFPIFVNIKSGWICIGDHDRPGEAIEFINNCVILIDNEGRFVSLRLKPKSLPKFFNSKESIYQKLKSIFLKSN